MPPVFSSVKRKKQKRKKKGSLSTLDNTSNEEVFIITSAFRPFPDLFSIHLIARGGEAGQLRSLQQRGFSISFPPPSVADHFESACRVLHKVFSH